MKALLFINGSAPEHFPEISDYTCIGCTDGAFSYLKDKNFPLQKLDFISGDFDHLNVQDAQDEVKNAKKTSGESSECEIIFTPDQNKTDFEKSLEILSERGFDQVDVFGGSGKEMDHFLGNLSVAYRFKD